MIRNTRIPNFWFPLFFTCKGIDMQDALTISGVTKNFTLHTQDATTIPVFDNVALTVIQGECVALTGASGSGKSTLMRMIYGNYVCSSGEIKLRIGNDDWLDLATATPHQVIEARRSTLGYVSQFLRVIPRVPTLEIVAEPLLETGVALEEALETARTLLERLNVPSRLWTLSPLTFSGGEQQRVNVARGFAMRYPVLLLDEPTASLDKTNRSVVLDMIEEARDAGSAILGIFHDEEARNRVCTRHFDVTDFQG